MNNINQIINKARGLFTREKIGMMMPVYLAIVGLLLMIYYVSHSQLKVKEQAPIREASVSSFDKFVSGTGVIEGYGENHLLNSYLDGRITGILVREGDIVTAGKPLIIMDTSQLNRQASSQQAQIDSISAGLAKAETDYQTKLTTYERYTEARKARAVSDEDYDQKRNQYEIAAKEIKKLKADLKASQNKLAEINNQQSLSTIKAPISGRILKIYKHLGEHVSPNETILIIASDKMLQVRIDIDEISSVNIIPHMRGEAVVKGHSDKKFVINYHHIIPILTPKVSLTGASTERTDTRVLQIIYTFERPEFPVYIGQQVDIYLERK